LVLEGEKAKGGWALIRTRLDGGKNQWLLLKSDADVRPVSKKRDDQSVKTGRTMKQIARDRDAEWESNRPNENKSSQSVLRDKIRQAVSRRASNPKKKPALAPKTGKSGIELPSSLP